MFVIRCTEIDQTTKGVRVCPSTDDERDCVAVGSIRFHPIPKSEWSVTTATKRMVGGRYPNKDAAIHELIKLELDDLQSQSQPPTGSLAVLIGFLKDAKENWMSTLDTADIP